MPVQTQLVEPIGSAGEIAALPLPELARASHVQIVVIALEADLAAGRDDQIVTGSCPENVVAQAHVWRAIQNANGIATGLIDRVVNNEGTAGAVGDCDEDACIAIGVDQVVQHL